VDSILYHKFAEKYNVSRETFLQLTEYVELLQKWQKKINLVSPTTIENAWERHIEDSLQLLPYVSREASAVIDLGSGAGLPGIPVAITTKLPVWLIESDRKKCSFLEESARICGLQNAKIICERIEKAVVDISNINTEKKEIIITARALAELTELFGLINHLCVNNKLGPCKLLLPKGQSADKELEQAKLKWDFDFEKFSSVTDSRASILLIKNLRRKQ